MENPNQSYEKLSEHLITTLRRVNNKIKAKLNLEKDVDLANLSFIVSNLYFMKTESKNPAVSHVIANGKIEFMFGVKTERDIDAIDKKEASEFALDYPATELIQDVLNLAGSGNAKALTEFLDKNFENKGEIIDHTEGIMDINKIKNR